jgi:hypothetical protein
MRFEFITPSTSNTEIQRMVTEIASRVAENIPGVPFDVEILEPNDLTHRTIIRVNVPPIIDKNIL